MKTKWLNIVLLSGLASPGWALVVAPSRTEVHLVPGASTSAQLTVTNDDKVDVQVDVSKKDWFIPETNKAWPVDRWLELHGPARFVLKPGQTQKVDVTVSCPKKMMGEVVGMVSFLYQTEQTSNVTPMISVSMYVIAKGFEKLDGNIKDLFVRKWNGQLFVSAIVRSTGNIHLRPSGHLLVTDAKGTELAAISIAEGAPTYPGTENTYGGQVPSTVKLPAGMYTAQADLKYQDLKLMGSRNFTILPTGELQMAPVKL